MRCMHYKVLRKMTVFQKLYTAMYNLNTIGVYGITSTRFNTDIEQFYDIPLSHTHTHVQATKKKCGTGYAGNIFQQPK